jgi:glutamate carboxypeptidase
MKRFLRLSFCAAFILAAFFLPVLAQPDETVLRAAEGQKTTYLRTLEQLVSNDSGTDDGPGLAKLQELLAARLIELGAFVEITDASPSAGKTITARFEGMGERSILLMDHYDTVFLPGDAAKRPLRIEGNRAFGPGVADAKGGISIILHALQILKDRGFKNYKVITVLFNADEERSSIGSRAQIKRIAAEHDYAHDYALSYEPPDEEQVTVATNGIAYVHLRVKGVASHAGSAPERGRNAAIELAHQLLQLQKLGDPEKGTTVNWTLVHAGDKVNIIPDAAEATADMRLSDVSEIVRVQNDGDAIIKNKLIPGTEASFAVENRRPPFSRNVPTENLAALAVSIYGELGKTLKTGAMRFGTDAGYAWNPNSPRPAVLETLGLLGSKIHTPGEYAELDSIMPRLYLSVRMIEVLCGTK